MDTSSYLFMSKRKKLKFLLRVMDKHSSTGSDISIDSLENTVKEKPRTKNGVSEDNVDTILVPFYEKDVLIKVPKDQKTKQNNSANKQVKSKDSNKSAHQMNSYLVNSKQKSKRSSYLEMFRKQFAPTRIEKKVDPNDVSSLLPEVGDSERESIGDDANHPPTEFYNTESYNEMYYEKLLNRDLEQYLDNSFEGLQFTEDITNKSPDDNADNLRSVSEVSQPRRRTRQATVQPVPDIKLGGLGPDMERIKPRLERARSLQRYSEKVRIENRLKIYKQSVQADMEKKEERQQSARQPSARRRDSARKERIDDLNASYLMNKSENEKKSRQNAKTWSKSADVLRSRDKREVNETSKEKLASKKNQISRQQQTSKTKTETSNYGDKINEEMPKSRSRSSAKNKGINTEKQMESVVIPPVQISFMVNVGGVRPSSALKTLEEKHRMYQEQVKAIMDNNV